MTTTRHNLAAVSTQDVRKTCLDKIAYDTRNIARDVAAKATKRLEHPLTVYRCLCCSKFHLTHYSVKAKPGIKARLRKKNSTKMELRA